MKSGMCPLCGKSDLREITAPPIGIGISHFAGIKLGLSLCRNCGLRFVNPRPSDELLSAFYNREDYECHDMNFEAAIAPRGEAVRLRILRKHDASGVLCDFGPGAGHLLRAAAADGWKVCGVEAGARARRELSDEGFTIFQDLGQLPENTGVGTLTMVHVLEHLSDPHTILGRVRKLLRRSGSGVFYVEVPNANSLRARLAVSPLKPLWTNSAERYLAFPIHLLYFNRRSLRLLLDLSGFRIVEMGTLGLGVEELLAKPANGGGAVPAINMTVSASSTALSPVKELIKASFSRFFLGENLYAVCRPT